MKLSRRTVLWGGAAASIEASGLGRIKTALASPLSLTARPVLVIHADDADAQVFQQTAQQTIRHLAPDTEIAVQLLSGGQPTGFGDFTRLLDQAQGRRILAMVQDRDATILQALLADHGVTQHFHGLHTAATGRSRHVLKMGQATVGIGRAFAAQSDAAWPVALGRLLGMASAGCWRPVASSGTWRQGARSGHGRSLTSFIADI